jgi:hypothetical protein
VPPQLLQHVVERGQTSSHPSVDTVQGKAAQIPVLVMGMKPAEYGGKVTDGDAEGDGPGWGLGASVLWGEAGRPRIKHVSAAKVAVAVPLMATDSDSRAPGAG